MSYMDDAVDEAVKRLKEPHHEKNGLIIWKIAQKYGAPVSELAKALKERQEKMRNAEVTRQYYETVLVNRQEWKGEHKMNETVWLDMDKVKALGCGGDLGKLARFCDMGHDTLRIADGRGGKGVQRRTLNKIAATFGVDPLTLLHEEDRQVELTEVKEDNRGQQPPITEEEAQERKSKMKTQGRQGCKAERINMAFTPDNHKAIEVLAKWRGTTMTKICNAIIARYLEEHKEIVEKIKESAELLADLKL